MKNLLFISLVFLTNCKSIYPDEPGNNTLGEYCNNDDKCDRETQQCRGPLYYIPDASVPQSTTKPEDHIFQAKRCVPNTTPYCPMLDGKKGKVDMVKLQDKYEEFRQSLNPEVTAPKAFFCIIPKMVDV